MMVVVGAVLKPKISRPPKRKVYLYAKSNFTDIDNEMNKFCETLTDETFASGSVEQLFTSFKNTLFDAIVYSFQNEFQPLFTSVDYHFIIQ